MSLTSKIIYASRYSKSPRLWQQLQLRLFSGPGLPDGPAFPRSPPFNPVIIGSPSSTVGAFSPGSGLSPLAPLSQAVLSHLSALLSRLSFSHFGPAETVDIRPSLIRLSSIFVRAEPCQEP